MKKVIIIGAGMMDWRPHFFWDTWDNSYWHHMANSLASQLGIGNISDPDFVLGKLTNLYPIIIWGGDIVCQLADHSTRNPCTNSLPLVVGCHQYKFGDMVNRSAPDYWAVAMTPTA
jgi:hypothetical protein